MKKIPTLFVREFENHKIIRVTEQVTPGMEWVLSGDGIATIKWDGTCCMIKDGELYKRYDAKNGKTPPDGAIPCCDPDPITGHWPHWLKCRRDDPADKYFFQALDKATDHLADGTYELVGRHVRGNPYDYAADVLIPHGKDVIEVERTFDGIREFLLNHHLEGLVFWKDAEPQCKIKRSDFGFPWP